MRLEDFQFDPIKNISFDEYHCLIHNVRKKKKKHIHFILSIQTGQDSKRNKKKKKMFYIKDAQMR